MILKKNVCILLDNFRNAREINESIESNRRHIKIENEEAMTLERKEMNNTIKNEYYQKFILACVYRRQLMY